MSKKNFCSQCDAKVALGKLISKLRKKKNLTLRKLAELVGLCPSNLSYIERGINAPTAEIYQNIIVVLEPETEIRRTLDELYTTIRKMPPPDVCEILAINFPLGEKIRLLKNIQLSTQQVESVEKLFSTFKN